MYETDIDIIKNLIKNNDDSIDYCDSEGNNAFLWTCCFNSNIEIIKYFIDINIGVDHVNNNGNNAFMLSCKFNKNLDIVEYLMKTVLDINKKINMVKHV